MTEGNEPAYPTKKQFVDWFYGREDYFPTPHQCYDWLMENGQLSPIPTKEGLEERAEKWADKISGTSDQCRIGLVPMKEKWVHDWVKEAYIAGAQSSLQPSSPDPTVLVQPISALHLRAEGEFVILEIEVNGKWALLIKERLDSAFSHIIEPSGIKQSIEKQKS